VCPRAGLDVGLGTYREWKKTEFPKEYYTNLGMTRLRGRPRNRWKYEVREDGTISDVWLTVHRNSVWIRKTN
jgi:hypothetical protein